MPRPTLDPVEVRVVGALAEKSLATPEQYPMSLAGLRAACNQKTSREPVTDLSEREVSDALERLMRRQLAGTTTGSGQRVTKFRHTLDRALELSARELAALSLLMLRGPQTAGEIRARSGRLADFASVEDADEALWMLSDRDEPLAVRLPREPGRSADRWAHALSGEPDPSPSAPAPEQRDGPSVEALESRVAALEEAFEAFKRQFE